MLVIPYKLHGVFKMKNRKNYSREEREVMIVSAFAVEIQHRRPNKMTAYQIAKKLGITASTHLNGILQQMVADGRLNAAIEPNPGRWTTRFYDLPEGTYTPPKSIRSIVFKQNGKFVDQLDLWS